MTSGIFDCYKTAKSQGKIDLINDDIVCVLVDSDYVPDFESDCYYTDIPEAFILSEGLLLSKYIEDNKFKAVSPILSDVEADNTTKGIVLYKDADYIEDTLLLAYMEFEIEETTDGNPVTINWNSSGIFQL